MSTQNPELLSSDPKNTTPSPTARDLKRHWDVQLAIQRQERQEAAQKVFEEIWLTATEAELKECCERYQASDDLSLRSSFEAYINVLCEKLKDHHLALGIFDTVEDIVERKRVCTALCLLREKDQQVKTSVSERLPPVSVVSEKL